MKSARFQRWAVCWLFLLFGLAAVLQVTLWEPYRLTTEHARIELPQWSAEAKPLRVVLLADLHPFPWDGAWMDRVVKEAVAQQPDLILLLGDFRNAVDHDKTMPPQELADRLAPLSKAAPVFFVTGNHEWGTWCADMVRAMQKKGFFSLENKTIRFSLSDGRQLDLRGEPCFGSRIRRHFAPPKEIDPADPPLLAVVHDPLDFLRCNTKADAVVAGHTHGGQVCLPDGYPLGSLGYMWTPDMLRAGLKTTKSGDPLYISRGIGMSVLPFRLNCPPEISVIELAGKGQGGAAAAR